MHVPHVRAHTSTPPHLHTQVLRVVEALPLTADVVYSVRSAHGTFANVLQELSSNADFDVRSKVRHGSVGNALQG
eukprot:350807-Chlamydomonas_euryale.AAC.1